MVRIITVGVGEEPVSDGTYSTLVLPGNTVTYINFAVPSLYTGTLDTFKISIDYTFAVGSTITFNTYTIEDLGGGSYHILKKHSSNSLNIPIIKYPENPGPLIIQLTGQSVPIVAGEYIGITITNASGENLWLSQNAAYWNVGVYYFYSSGNPSDWTSAVEGTSQYNIQAYGGSGVETGAVSADACQTTPDNIPTGGTWDGYAYINVVEILDIGGGVHQITLDITYPWGEHDATFIIYNNDPVQIKYRAGSNPNEYYSIIITYSTVLGGGFIKFKECWWRESDVYYVDNSGGNDDNMGVTWAQKFKTITKAASKVPANGKVYIAFGTYNDETASGTALGIPPIKPVNIGVIPIKYSPVTSGTSSGTGNVVINL